MKRVSDGILKEKEFLDFKKAVQDARLKSASCPSYFIMTINMNGKNQGKGTASRRKDLIVSTIKQSSASVIFCQEVPGKFKKEVVEKCGDYGDAVTDKTSAVMWRKSDFDGDRQFVKGTDSSIIRIVDRLQKNNSDVDVSEVRTRTAMVELTSRKTGASFLAVSWHGPRKVNKASKKTKLEVFCDFIRLLRVVCEKEELSSFIIGGDFNFNTSKVNDDRQTEYGVTILRYELCTRDKKQRGSSFVPYKDTLIFSVPSDKPPMTGDITVSSVAPLELENESGENALLDHVPVVGDLEIVWPYKKPSIKQDKGKLEQKLSLALSSRLSFLVI